MSEPTSPPDAWEVVVDTEVTPPALEQREISVSKSTKASLKVYKSGDRTSTCIEFEDRILEQSLFLFPSVVGLNVGGYNYTSTSYTLTQYPDSKLAQMCNGIIPLARDLKGQQFIDRDGATFRYVLTFLRTAKLTLPEDFRYFDELKTEAEFYGIEPLIEAVEVKIKKNAETKEQRYIRLSYSKSSTGVLLTGKLENLQEIIPEVEQAGGTLYSGNDYEFTLGDITVNGAQIQLPMKRTQVDSLVQHIISQGYDVKGAAVAFDENDNLVLIFTRNKGAVSLNKPSNL